MLLSDNPERYISHLYHTTLLFPVESWNRHGIVFYFLYLVRFCTTGLNPASGTFHPYPAAALYNSVNQSYMLHLFWQIFQSLPPSSCNLLMFSLPLLSSIPRSRSMGTPLQYRQIHRKTLFLTDSFFLFL